MYGIHITVTYRVTNIKMSMHPSIHPFLAPSILPSIPSLYFSSPSLHPSIAFSLLSTSLPSLYPSPCPFIHPSILLSIPHSFHFSVFPSVLQSQALTPVPTSTLPFQILPIRLWSEYANTRSTSSGLGLVYACEATKLRS